MLLRYPGRIKAQSSSEQMVLNLDMAPTLLEIAGLPVQAEMQGKSMLPLAEGKLDLPWRKDWLYEYYEYPGFENVRPCRGVRTERYKLIHFFIEPQEFELYDLQADPDEMNNLYGKPDYEELVARLKKRLAELRAEKRYLRVQAYGHASALEPRSSNRVRACNSEEIGYPETRLCSRILVQRTLSGRAQQTFSSTEDSVPTSGFHIMTKPIGPICNLDCKYCFYLEKENLYPDTRHWAMSRDTLERYIRQYIAAQPSEQIHFAWQGGEPTLLACQTHRRSFDIALS
jgi:hypothetical protein